jgi:anti-sigma regulatory factor (Ser/Thr protein kinase)
VAILLVSELASNAVEHAQGGFGIRVVFDPPQLLVEVHDRSTKPPVRRDPRPADSRRRGIMIVDALAASWGYRPSEEGKVVWFRLDFQASGPSDTGETEKPSGSSEDE